MYYRRIGGVFLLLLLVGCAPRFTPMFQHKQQSKLYTLLLQTYPKISHREASLLAREAVTYSQALASKYRVTTPPLFHNFLVNIKLKDRGLCYQWSDDLYHHLQKFHLTSIQLLPVGAYIGSYWREHNAIVILPLGSHGTKDGILLDAWRHSGKLYFVPIHKDPEYQWKIRTDRYNIYQNGK